MSNVYDGDVDNLVTNASNFMMPRADIRPDAFDSIVEQKGYRIIWEQGMFCPCMRLESGQPKYECPLCGGKGYKYIQPTEIRAVVTSINGRKDQHRIGLDEVGGAYITPPSKYDVGYRDRFTFIDFTAKFSEVIIKGDIEEHDRLRYNCLKIIALATEQKEYVYGIHFTLTDDNLHIEWLKDEPYPGEQYSVLYNIRPVYIAMNPVHELRGTYTRMKAHGMEKFMQLPKQFQIKREDFVDPSHAGVTQNAFT